MSGEFSKEDVYRELAFRYKLTYHQIASMNPFQQISMLKTGIKEETTKQFNSFEEYLAWKAMNNGE